MFLPSGIVLIDRAHAHGPSTAIVDPQGSYSYTALLDQSAVLALHLLAGCPDLQEARVVFLVPRGFTYAWVQWGIWRAGGIAVPLSELHPPPELEYVAVDSEADYFITHPLYEDRLRPLASSLGKRLILTTEIRGITLSSSALSLPSLSADRRAMILYTSGSTGRPKGVVCTHGNLAAQVAALVEAWEWRPDDRILNPLPLHHIHGIINVMSCALWSGAVCEFMPKFEAAAVWERFLSGGLTLFMAVPTIYHRLIEYYEAVEPVKQASLSEACNAFRLMVSGSAALPVSVWQKWRQISGHLLLERYGMTETGMVFANPLHGERRPGYVGHPLPRVEIRLVDHAGSPVDCGQPGEISVRGPGVFCQYWRRPTVTATAFRNGWFLTGDIAVYEGGAYRILGRKSVDIIKTGGYKVSALEIEGVLREHPAIVEVAVVGMKDKAWGQRVCAVVVPKSGLTLSLEKLRSWAKERLAPYKVPTRLFLLDTLPRNAMGKVMKSTLLASLREREAEA